MNEIDYQFLAEKDEYIRQKAIERQDHIVNFKSSTTLTSEALVWTYRTTNCDVVSVITTAFPIINGHMKDIKIEYFEPKRLKPPTIKKTPKDIMGISPYDIGLSVDKEKKRKKVNKMLQIEKKEFMNKLALTRFVRSKLENEAAGKIQKIFRGFFIRNTVAELVHYLTINRMIRANLRSFLDSNGYHTSSLNKYKQRREKLRNHSARLIQCIFFRYLSRKYYRRRLFEQKLLLKTRSAIVIQALVRGKIARSKVKLLVERNRILLCIRSAIKIQSALRGLYARRRVRKRRMKLQWLACRMIQSWYRAKYSRRMAAHIKNILHLRKTNRGALALQGIVRKFLAKRRVERIRIRRFHVIIMKNVTIIQCLIRKFLGRIRVRKIRTIKKEKDIHNYELKREKESQEEIEKINSENKALLDSVDIFLQVNLGNTTEVEDIFKGLVGEAHSPDETDSNLENILTLASKNGNLDLVRKSIIWGFDINHHNINGHNAIMIAAKHNHLEVVKYLLSFFPTAENHPTSGQILVLSPDEVGYLLVTAAANSAFTNLEMLQCFIAAGMDINQRSALAMGMTALHAVCEIGHVEGFKLLHKNKVRMDEGVIDDLNQHPLHKACCSSIILVEWILGLDPEFNTFMSDSDRLTRINSIDVDGKDCVIHAALSGHNDILEILEKLLFNNGSLEIPSSSSKKHPNPASKPNGEIGWTPADINKAIHLVEAGNIYCIQKIINFGFDPSWCQEDTDVNMILAACKFGDLDIIDLLMDIGLNFTCVDNFHRSIFHYVVLSETNNTPSGTSCSEVLSHIISHAKAVKCAISRDLMLTVDKNQENLFHYAARYGIDINIDLLAGVELMGILLNAENKSFLSPLHIACQYYHPKLIENYIRLGADPLIIDDQNHSCIWFLYHPHESVLSHRRIFASEHHIHYTSPSGHQSSFHSKSRKEKDEDAARIQTEISIIVTLLKAGCTLYHDYSLSPEDLLNSKNLISEAGDIMIQEYSLSCLKALLPGIINPLDAWRLYIGSLLYDDGSQKILSHLLRLGIIEVITQDFTNVVSDHFQDAHSIEATAAAFSRSAEETVHTQSISNTKKSVAIRASAAPLGLNRMSSTASMNRELDNYHFNNSVEIFYLDMNMTAWAIRLKHSKMLQIIVKKNYNVTLPVDIYGNPCLHYIAQYGAPEMVDIILQDKRARYEQLNRQGFTPAMVAVKYQNFPVAKKFFQTKFNSRKSLEGKYSAWALAFVRRIEQQEKNTQTGRYGEDDELYFNIAPDPFYSTWYS